jgi:hypothetical protein
MAANDLARLVVKLEAQTAQYDASLKKATVELKKFRGETTASLTKIQKQFSDFGKNILKTFAIGSLTTAVYGLTRAMSEAFKSGNDLAIFATKSGLAAKAASELAYAARNAEIDLETLGKSLQFMQVNLSKIGTSDGDEAAKILAAIGLEAAELKNLKPEEQFLAIGDAIKRLPSIESQTRAWQFFGKAGLDLAPAFENGAEGIRKAMDEAERLGQSFTEEDLQRFKDADDAFDRLAGAGRGLANAFAIHVAPAVTQVTETMTKLLSLDFSKFIGFMAAAPHQKLVLLAQMFKDSGKGAQTVRGTIDRGPAALPPSDFKPDPAKIPKLSDAEMAELERFKNQAVQIGNDLAGAFNSIAPSLDENATAIGAYFAQIREDTIGTTARVIEFGETFKEQTTEMDVFAEQAARNMQDAFAQFFMDFDKGLDGMLEGFLRAIQQMAANLAASQLLSMLGGSLAGSANPFLSSLGGALTGARATGGPVSAGGAYMVGERGPELFVPGASGRIVPNSQLGGGLTYAPVINAQGADASLRAALPGILQDHSRQMLAHIRDQQQRGAM